MVATNAQAIAAYEAKLGDLEDRKARLIEERDNQAVPSGTFEEKLEPLLLFLSNPLKLWETASVKLRRTVLKMAFADRIRYDRNQGARTPELSFPFRMLGGNLDQQVFFGAGGGTRTHTGLRPNRF